MADDARVALLAPSPILTITLEEERPEAELHLHAGGQGYWVARMLRVLGVEVGFCAPLGGEVGTVLRALIETQGIELHAVESGGWNGSYVHRRGRGDAVTLGETASPLLARHETDALYAAMVTAALSARLAVLTGPRSEEVIDPDFYRRLARDLRDNGCTVVADLSGKALVAALAGGLDVLHLSARELGEHGAAPRDVPRPSRRWSGCATRAPATRSCLEGVNRHSLCLTTVHSSCPGRCSKSVSIAARATRCSPRSPHRSRVGSLSTMRCAWAPPPAP